MSKTTMPPHGNRLYPWDRWEDGRKHKARRGQHFAIPVETFRRSLAVRARRRKKQVTTRVKGDVVTFQFEDAASGVTAR